MNPEELIYHIEKTAENIPSILVRRALRLMMFHRVTDRTIRIVRYCLAIEKLGLPLTTHLLSYLFYRKVDHTTRSNILRFLHLLGDKHVLTLVRESKGKTYRWVISPLFKRMLEEAKKI